MKLTSLFGKKVYSVLGKYIGTVVDVIVNLGRREIAKIDVGVKLPSGDKKRIIIPYRWLYSIEDVILVKKENT